MEKSLLEPKPKRGASSTTFKIFFYQLTGTLFFAYGICASNTLAVGGSLFVSLSLFLAICWGGEFSGGHFNGAVSLGMAFKRNGISLSRWLVYYISQSIGAFLGTYLASYLINQTNAPMVFGVTGFQSFQFFMGQIMGTFIFVFCILLATTRETSFIQDKIFIYLFIVLVLYIGRSFAYNTGGLNPSLALGMGIAFASINDAWYIMSQAWVVILGPFIGGALAAIFFEKLYKPTLLLWKEKR